MNEAQQKVFVTVDTIGAIILLSLSNAVVIRLWYRDSNYMIICILGIVLLASGSVLLFLLGGMAEILVHSKNYLTAAKGLLEKPWQSKPNRRNLRVIVKSCQQISVKFGSINFIEALTPINCLDFANDLTVQLLLIASNK